MSLMAVTKLSKSFGGLKAVSRLDFELHEGEILAIIGPNGAGKTTTLNMLSGMLLPSSGTVVFRGQDITRSAPSA
ncbi:MAG: ATP-binding cassette domain-containing protein, partial [Deinococcota bacterium]|nr:ATP-binding cassette domain-containing protein [Deinococcota bacterium]